VDAEHRQDWGRGVCGSSLGWRCRTPGNLGWRPCAEILGEHERGNCSTRPTIFGQRLKNVEQSGGIVDLTLNLRRIGLNGEATHNNPAGAAWGRWGAECEVHCIRSAGTLCRSINSNLPLSGTATGYSICIE
jgi:hypothetical protein